MLLRAILLLILLTGPALAERRVALVIGNSAYVHAPALPNPKNDATEVAKKLAAIGYEVQLEEDLTGQAFRVALGAFSETAQNADLALVFYAGHGIELGGRNFLIPVDSEMKSESSAQFESVALDQVLSTVREAKTLGIVMLDACRDNPFAATMTRSNGTRSVSRGLAPISVEGEGGLLVSFAAEAGNTASDGDSGHSPYTEAFLEVLDQPDLEVGKMFRTLRAKVREKSKGKQIPVEQAQLPDHDVFITPISSTIVPTQPLQTAPQPVIVVPDAAALFFEAASENDVAKLSDFVARYPDHPRASDARKMIDIIQDDQMWAMVLSEGNSDAMRRYILVFPGGKHLDEATAALASMEPGPQQVIPPTPEPIAPTFKCSFAKTDVELAICASNELALQDHLLVDAFKTALSSDKVTKSDQKQWVSAREGHCTGLGDAVAGCVYTYTAERIVELKGTW